MAKFGAYARVSFCPLCGVEALEKDRYREAKNCPKAEYICKSCGFGFRICESARVQLANQLFANERKYRNHKTMGEGVSPEIAEKAVQFLEVPMRRMSMRTWLRKYLPKLRSTRVERTNLAAGSQGGETKPTAAFASSSSPCGQERPTSEPAPAVPAQVPGGNESSPK